MSQVLITESNLTAIANAIRGRNGSSDTYKPGQMAEAVTAIPNSYTAGDEGKVVDNGALVSQSSMSVTENGIYDTTKKNSVNVNVSSPYSSMLMNSHRATNGYVTTAGVFFYTGPNDQYSIDVFEVQQGKTYAFFNGASYGNRFRAMFSTTDTAQATADIVGNSIIMHDSLTSPIVIGYTAVGNGYVTIVSSNQGEQYQVYGICITDSVSGIYTP